MQLATINALAMVNFNSLFPFPALWSFFNSFFSSPLLVMQVLVEKMVCVNASTTGDLACPMILVIAPIEFVLTILLG